MKVQVAFMDRVTDMREPMPCKAGSGGREWRGILMAEYRQMSLYFDLEKPDEAWAYQFLMSLRHGKKAMVITALKMMLGKGGQAAPFSARAVPPGNGRKNKATGRQAFGRSAAESCADAGDAPGGAGEKQDKMPAERESRGSSDGEPVEDVLPDAVSSPAGKGIAPRGDGEMESDWRAFFTQEQLAAILEKNLDMSQLTEDGIRQMAGQAGSGIPVKAAYKEALMWCR